MGILPLFTMTFGELALLTVREKFSLPMYWLRFQCIDAMQWLARKHGTDAREYALKNFQKIG